MVSEYDIVLEVKGVAASYPGHHINLHLVDRLTYLHQ